MKLYENTIPLAENQVLFAQLWRPQCVICRVTMRVRDILSSHGGNSDNTRVSIENVSGAIPFPNLAARLVLLTWLEFHIIPSFADLKCNPFSAQDV